MDGPITKPMRFNPDEKTLGSFSTQADVPSVSEKLVWSRAKVLERLGGDEELLRELCQIFMLESPKLLVKLQRAIVDSDAQGVMRAAHSLRGELGYLGAAGASLAAQELEDMGRNNNLLRAAEILVGLERELTSLHLAMKDSAGAIQ